MERNILGHLSQTILHGRFNFEFNEIVPSVIFSSKQINNKDDHFCFHVWTVVEHETSTERINQIKETAGVFFMKRYRSFLKMLEKFAQIVFVSNMLIQFHL